MPSAPLFYSALTLKSMEPFLHRCQQYQASDSMDRFPLCFANSSNKKPSLGFLSKYLVSSQQKQYLQAILQIMSHSNPHNAPLSQTSLIEPTLLSRIRQKAYPYDIHIDPSFKVSIQESRILQKSSYKGVFMHRALNMPLDCYSVHEYKQNMIEIKMQENMTRSDYLTLLNHKKRDYQANSYQMEKYYLDSYHNFIKNEEIIRTVLQVNAVIQGQLVFLDGKNCKHVALPLNKDNPVTTHILQFETIKVPGRSWRETTLITDIDYFMQGNPHAQ